MKADFAYFKHFSTYDKFIKDLIKLEGEKEVTGDTIVFVQDTGTIYTHGGTFGGRSVTYTGEEGVVINSDHVISLDKDWLNQYFANFNPGTNPSVVYTAGEGISILNNKISVKPASDTEFGAIKLGYLANGKNYPLLLSNGKAYVNVPWESGGNNEDGKPGNYYQQAFKTTDTKTPVPDLPLNFPNGTDGWKKYAENANAEKYVWMATRLVDYTGEPVESWQGPWLITGPQGIAGADGKDIEFIYARSGQSDDHPSGYDSKIGTIKVGDSRVAINFNDPSETRKYEDVDDFVPNGWLDNPQGVANESDKKCEWVSIRTKRNETWSSFGMPFLWSRWGLNGMDGDGIEYIFKTTSGSIPVGDDDPSYWDIEQYSEYLGPEDHEWSDNPIDMDSLPQGTKQWVSIRKYTGGEVGTDKGKWGAFCSPRLWSYVPKDGIVEGYTINLTNPYIPVPVNGSGNVDSFNAGCEIQVFQNGNPYTNFTVEASHEFATVDGKIVSIRLNNVSDFKGVQIPVTAVINNSTRIGGTIHVYPVQLPSNILQADLKVNSLVIYTDYYKTKCTPKTITPYIKLSSTDEALNNTNITPTSLDNKGFTFKYRYVSATDQTDEVPLITDGITIQDYNHDYLTITAYLNDKFYDSQDVVFVREGAPGIGISPLLYNIEVLSNSMTVENGNLSGLINFKVYIQQGSLNTEITSENQIENVVLKVETNGATKDPEYIDELWSVSVDENYNNVPYTRIFLTTVNGSVLRSIVVPFIMKGEPGLAGVTTTIVKTEVQGLDGTVIRFLIPGEDYDWSNCNYKDGTTPSEDGITYLDVVYYKGGYFRIIPGMEGKVNLPPVNDLNQLNKTQWIFFDSLDSAAFLAIIAKYAFIENLTAKQIVITDDEDQKVVAGMCNGNFINSDDRFDGTTDGVRIWAGPMEPGTANLATVPFYVTNEGKMVAKNAVISGSVIADSVFYHKIVPVNSSDPYIPVFSMDTNNMPVLLGDIIFIRGSYQSEATINFPPAKLLPGAAIRIINGTRKRSNPGQEEPDRSIFKYAVVNDIGGCPRREDNFLKATNAFGIAADIVVTYNDTDPAYLPFDYIERPELQNYYTVDLVSCPNFYLGGNIDETTLDYVWMIVNARK